MPLTSIFGLPSLLKKRPPLSAVLVPSPVSLSTFAFQFNFLIAIIKDNKALPLLQNAGKYFLIYNEYYYKVIHIRIKFIRQQRFMRLNLCLCLLLFVAPYNQAQKHSLYYITAD